MKTYAIQVSDGQYVEYTNQRLFNSYRTTTVRSTPDVAKAKHYKTEGRANGVLKSRITGLNNLVESKQASMANTIAKGGKPHSWDQDSVDAWTKLVAFINTCTVVEVDVSTPNYTAKAVQDVKFYSYGVGFETKKSQGNMYCKGCGIYFKAIPIMQFGKADRPSRICPWCIQERAHEAQKLLDAMPDEQRENAEAERFIHKMG